MRKKPHTLLTSVKERRINHFNRKKQGLCNAGEAATCHLGGLFLTNKHSQNKYHQLLRPVSPRTMIIMMMSHRVGDSAPGKISRLFIKAFNCVSDSYSWCRSFQQPFGLWNPLKACVDFLTVFRTCSGWATLAWSMQCASAACCQADTCTTW